MPSPPILPFLGADFLLSRILHQRLSWPSIGHTPQAVLHILGYEQAIIDDWIQMRKIIQDRFYSALTTYDVEKQEDFTKWSYCDICLDGITDDMLSTESPIGYLGKQWLIYVKEAISASIVLKNHKARYEAAAKALADAEMAKTITEVDLKAATDEVSQLRVQLEELSPLDDKEVRQSNEAEDEGNGDE
eukprot:Gb_12536 [translate_table: standard]